MNEMQKDNFDMLISAAVVQCVHHDADTLSSVDVSEVPDTSRLYKKVMRNLPGSRRTAVKAIVTLALAAALLALTACACLPDVRDYFWGVVTEWYGDHFEVSFDKEQHSDEKQTTISQSDFPSMIEKKAVLKYLPDGSSYGDETMMLGQYHSNYYLDNGEWSFTFSQYAITDDKAYLDAESSNAIRVLINNDEGVLMEIEDSNNVLYYLIWQDDFYRYSITGNFKSLSVLLKVAENLELTPIS